MKKLKINYDEKYISEMILKALHNIILHPHSVLTVNILHKR